MDSGAAPQLPKGSPSARPEFPSTHWTLIARVRQGGAVRQAALEELCGLYWYPIYAFLRRRGFAQHDAEDLAQGFFLKLLSNGSFDAAEENRGRLRSFLLGALERFLVDSQRRNGALKRGAGQQLVSFDELRAEERYALEPRDERDPERLYARSWAHLLLGNVRAQLQASFAEAGRASVFEALLPFLLPEEAPPTYREVAQKLEASETAVRLLVFRMRSRFRELLTEEVSRTVAEPSEAAQELAWLRSVLTP